MVLITFVIPVHPDLVPVEAIRHIRQLSYPEEKIEILVVEGKRPSVQRNQAVAKARGEFIYFLDDDSHIDTKSLEACLQYFDDPHVAAVGGPAITHDEASLWEGFFGAALSSGFGAGSVKVRSRIVGTAREVRGEELILCNLIVRKSTFLACGGLNPSLYPNEENEFLKRLRKEGHRFFYIPEMIVRRARRKGIPQFVQQMRSYGRGRSRHIFTHFACRDLFFLIPSAFTVYLCLLLCFPSVPAVVPLLLYAIVSVCAALKGAVRERDWSIFFGLLFVFPLMHVAYGIGLLEGLLRRKRSKEFVDEHPIRVRLIESIGIESVGSVADR